MSAFSGWLRAKGFIGKKNPLPPYVRVGHRSYGVTRQTAFMATPDAPLTIGSYCSIGPEVVIMCSGNHSTDCATSFPVHMLLLKKPSPVENGGKALGVNIGSDVWIGLRATILPGVNIGHGAIIGANAVVTRDIPPYAIAVGNPARIIRYRFDEDTISKLLSIRWWEWDESKIKQEAGSLAGPIGTFIARHFDPAAIGRAPAHPLHTGGVAGSIPASPAICGTNPHGSEFLRDEV